MLLSFAAAMVAAQPPAIDTVAARLVAELTDVPWGVTCAEWSAGRPGAGCLEFRGDGSSTRFEDGWCYEGHQRGALGSVFFYTLHGRGEPACLLERWEARTAAEPAAARRRIDAVEELLEERLGTAERPEEVKELGELTADFWADIRRWSDASVEILLHGRPGDRGGVEMIARRRPLLDALARERERGGPWSGWSRDHDRAAAAVIEEELPAFASWLRYGGPPDPHVAEAMIPELTRLLERAEAASGEGRAALLFTVDRLADRFAPRLADPPGSGPRGPTRPEVESLRALGLTVGWNHIGWMWHYQNDLLERLVTEHPHTSWGERAFVLLQRAGWDPSGVCAAGPDAFFRVIERGETFLAGHPDSPYGREVTLAVALAHETWWSLSRARNDGYAEPDAYREGAERARARAVELYRTLEAGEDGASYVARRQMPRLALGVDTNQRMFFCIYD